MKKFFLITGSLVGIILILGYIIVGLLISINKPVKSPYVLLEDWIPLTTVEYASNYVFENSIDSVFVFGMKNSISAANMPKFNKSRKLKKTNGAYAMYWGGILGFEVHTEKLNNSFALNLKMRGTKDVSQFPRYEIFMNNQLINTGFVTEKDSVYQFILSKNKSDSLTYILINFNNDKLSSTGDRNLYVSDIYIDSVHIDSVMTDNFFVSGTDNPMVDYISKLNSIKYYFDDLGYDTSRVKLIDVHYDPFNKTLAYAKSAKKYFHNTKITNINVITTKKHSRRSYLNFKNCLEDNKIEVGCIPENDIKRETSLYNGIDERISLLLTSIYWWIN
jgi:hypothetical protein